MNPYYAGPPSDHFDGLRFFNPGHAATDRGLRDFLRWRLNERAAVWPRSIPARQTVPELLLEALARHGIGRELFPAGEPGLSY